MTMAAKREREIDEVVDRPLAEMSTRELLNFLARDGIMLPDHAMGLFRDQLVLIQDRLAMVERCNVAFIRGEVERLKEEVRSARLGERTRPDKQLAVLNHQVQTLRETVRAVCHGNERLLDATRVLTSAVGVLVARTLNPETQAGTIEDAAKRVGELAAELEPEAYTLSSILALQPERSRQ